MRLTRFAVVFVVGGLGFAACDQFEAGPAASSDAGADGAADRATEAGATGDAGKPPATGFCDGAAFCDDFERTSDPKGPWMALDAVSGDQVTLTSDGPHQGSDALRFLIAKSTGTKHASLHTSIALSPKNQATLRVSYRPPASFGTSGSHTDLAYLAVLDAYGAGKPLLTALLVNDKGIYIDVKDQQQTYEDSKVITHRSAEWNEAALRVDLQGKTAYLDLNGEPNVASMPLDLPATLDGALQVWLGPSYGDQGGDFTIDYDALRVDLE